MKQVRKTIWPLSLLPSPFLQSLKLPSKFRSANPRQRVRSSQVLDEFLDLAFPHACCVYKDALCLTGNHEDAQDMVVSAYALAYKRYRTLDRQQSTDHLHGGGTKDWLYENLYEVWCDWARNRVMCVNPLKGDFS